MLLNAVGKTISRIGESAGIAVGKGSRGRRKFCSAHDLRRSFGQRWAAHVKPVILKTMMRHASIDTTLNYYICDDAEQIADVLWAVHDGGKEA